MKKLAIVVASLAVVFGAAACNDANNAARKTQNNDRATSARALVGFQTNQPVPVFTYSQLRQNLIEIETAQAQTTQTTSFFFNMGVADPTDSCPSIGFPIPATYQLTNPQQKVVDHDLTVPQVEATGVYTDQSTGTYVICVDAQGRAYANYWEGFVKTVTGPAKWNAAAHQVELVGAPSFTFSKGK